jgi:hypothetical protein
MVAKRSFPTSKFDKLMEQNFKDIDSHFENKDKVSNKKFVEDIKNLLDEKYGNAITVFIKNKYYYGKKEKEGFNIRIDIKNNMIFTEPISLLYEDNIVTFNYNKYKIANIENLYKFIDEYLVKIQEEVKGNLKKDKVKSLKTNAAISKIEELASELQFSYIIIDEFITKVKLIVKFEKSLAVEIDVTISRYKEILENLKELIISIRNLQELGIKTRWKSTTRYNESAWIKPKK